MKSINANATVAIIREKIVTIGIRKDIRNRLYEHVGKRQRNFPIADIVSEAVERWLDEQEKQQSPAIK